VTQKLPHAARISRAWRFLRDQQAIVDERVVGKERLPESIRALSSLAVIDYVDHFALSTATDATPEQ
jgi:hypothetical protein